MAKTEEVLAEGLSKIAHAIRRSTAAYVAMQMTPSDGSLDDWEDTADRVALWIGGNAAAREQAKIEEAAGEPPVSVGVRWQDRDQA